MKKFVTLLLSLVFVLSLFSCNQPGEETTPIDTQKDPEITSATDSQTTPEVQETTTAPEDLLHPPLDNDIDYENVETDPFDHYYEIVDAYGVAIQRFDLIHADDETIAKELELENISFAKSFRKILEAAYAFYPYDDKNEKMPSVERLLYYIYDESSDLNGDGHNELVLMTSDYRVLAIYSHIRKPRQNIWGDTIWLDYAVLLDTFTPEKGCWIDADGRIHVNELFGNSLYQRHAVYEIAQGGAKLNPIVEYGLESNGRLVKIEDGERIYITQTEFYALNEQYGSYLVPDERAEVTRMQAGLKSRALFTRSQTIIPEAMYRPVLNGDKPVLVAETGKYVYLKDYVPANTNVSLAKCETLRYVYYYVGEKDNLDVAIDCGSAKLNLTYDNGTVILTSLADEIWEEIERWDLYYLYDICALSAPWREAVLTPEEVEAIANTVWGIRDGDRDGATGKLYIYYVDVSEEPDADGYYLVAMRVETYRYCSYDDCPETDPNHRHLSDVENYRYMLVHEQTGAYYNNTRVSPERAKRIAEEYWGIADKTVIHGMGRTFVVRIDVSDGVGYGNELYSAYLRVECYSTLGFENGAEPIEVKNIDFVYIHRDGGGTYVYPYIEGK